MAANNFVGRPGITQSVAYTGTAGSVASGISNGVNRVRVVCTTDAYVTFDGSPPSATSGVYVPAKTPEYFAVSPGQIASAVQLSAGGTLSVTEITQ